MVFIFICLAPHTHTKNTFHPNIMTHKFLYLFRPCNKSVTFFMHIRCSKKVIGSSTTILCSLVVCMTNSEKEY